MEKQSKGKRKLIGEKHRAYSIEGMRHKKKKILAGLALIGAYIGLRVIAKKRMESPEIDRDNLYINIYENETHEPETIYEAKVKPVLDRILSFAGLVVLSPLFALISLAIIIDDPGMVFFTQKRIGKDRHYIQIHKFRSMRMDTPHDVPTHQLINPDEYITRVGRVLRRTSLDEIPQLWDIFRGRMSIIGPRPALWNQEDLIAERERYGANSVLPGLTGLAQIKGRDELLIPEKARLDGDYVKRLHQGGIRAFFFDTKYFFDTITAVLRKDGVVEGGTGSLKEKESFEAGFEDYGYLKHFNIDTQRKIKVLITGAGSYIGMSFADYCDRYYPNIEIHTVDMVDGSWRKEKFGCYDSVFHVAGIAHADVERISSSKRAKYYEVNTDLAVETAKKAKADGVKQFVFMSSMIIYGDSAPLGQSKKIDEYTDASPSNFYGDSKWQADKSIRELGDESFKVAVLRAPMVYGKNSKGNYQTLAKLSQKVPLFPKVSNNRSALYIENLCEFVGLLVLSGEGGIYFPQNQEYINTSELVRLINAVNGKKIWMSGILSPLVAVIGKMPGKIGALANKAFGNSIYDQKISKYDGLDYQKVSLRESIERIER